MSAIALSLYDDCALLACDGVCTDPATGAVCGYTSKITLLPEYDAALAITGVGGFDSLMRWFMPLRVQNFDDLIDVLPDLVRRVHDHIVEYGLSVGGDVRTNVVATGWSIRRQAFEGWRVLTYPKSMFNTVTGDETTFPPWVAIEMPKSGSWCSASPGPDVRARFGTDRPSDDDGATILTRLICAARADSGMITEGVRFNAGGFVQLALIQRSDVRSWIAHRWPEDVIGEPIDPSRGAMLPEWVKG